MRSFKYFNLDNIAEAELILTSIPNHDATHYLQMAKVMRTMFVGTIGLRYLETLVAEYKASAKTKLNLV